MSPSTRLDAAGRHHLALDASAHGVEDTLLPDGQLTAATLRAFRHELRTPINHVVGYCELLLDEVSEAGVAHWSPDLHRVRLAANELLQLANACLDPERFAAAAADIEQLSHAFRTPLNAVVGYSELLLEDAARVAPTLAPDLERIHGAGTALIRVVGALLDLARVGNPPPGSTARQSEVVSDRESESDAVGQAAAPGPNVVARGRRAGKSLGSGASTQVPTATAHPLPPITARLLVVDDNPVNRDLLGRTLQRAGYEVCEAEDGARALEVIENDGADLVLLDLLMPGMDGYQVCRAIRQNPRTAMLPVIMVTASGEQEKVQAIEAGADDFIPKPFNQSELLARVRSLLRIKAYHDTVLRQAAELAEWNRVLEERVRVQVEELERVGRLRRYLPPQVADLIVASGDESILQGRRRVVTVVFCDLRGFTAFAESVGPEELMAVLREYHAALGQLIHQYGGTLERFSGDGIMVFFNDPIEYVDHEERAVRMAIAMRARMAGLVDRWREQGHDLGFGMGIAEGEATLGRIGFDGRFDYAAIGRVTNLAARLCAEAHAGQILLSQPVRETVAQLADVEPVEDLRLKGFAQPVHAYNLAGLRGDAGLAL
ncbi:MAG: response regulator [Chloroflexi bacterium]|nr:response regulator [Chloroflexota bacterium]